jgi:hypothetical protein
MESIAGLTVVKKHIFTIEMVISNYFDLRTAPPQTVQIEWMHLPLLLGSVTTFVIYIRASF